jgi:hypothetical protein
VPEGARCAAGSAGTAGADIACTDTRDDCAAAPGGALEALPFDLRYREADGHTALSMRTAAGRFDTAPAEITALWAETSGSPGAAQA